MDQRIGMGIVGDVGRYTQYAAAESLDLAAANTGGGAGVGMGLGAGAAVAQVLATSLKASGTAPATGPAAGPAASAPVAGDAALRLGLGMQRLRLGLIPSSASTAEKLSRSVLIIVRTAARSSELPVVRRAAYCSARYRGL